MDRIDIMTKAAHSRRTKKTTTFRNDTAAICVDTYIYFIGDPQRETKTFLSFVSHFAFAARASVMNRLGARVWQIPAHITSLRNSVAIQAK